MTTRDILIAAWNSPTQPPTGVTGIGLTAQMTTDQKLAAINAWTVPTGVPVQALLSPSTILNAIVPADLAALTSPQVAFLTLVLEGSTVNVSLGTTIRTAIQTIFSGKTTTLQNLAALVAPFDNPTQLWWQANGFGSPITQADLAAAGGLT